MTFFSFVEDSKANVSGKVVNAFMEEVRHVGSAMLLMSTWYQCSKYVLDNPKFSKRFVSSRNIDLKRFRKEPSRKQFVKDSVSCFFKYQSKKSKVVDKKESKSHYTLQLLDTSDKECDNDEPKENINETANEHYTSSDDASVSSSESEQDQVKPIISKSQKSKTKKTNGKKKANAVKRKSSSSSSSESEEDQVKPIISKSEKIKTKKTNGRKKANAVKRNSASSASDSEVVRKVKRKTQTFRLNRTYREEK